MDLSGISAATSTSLSGLPQSEALDKNAFMQLLVHQLQNQDPLEPVANEDFIAQLASFSSLEEIQSLNENIVSMVFLQQSNALLQQLTDSSALIGRTVTYYDAATQQEQEGVVTSVKVEDGLAQLNIGGKAIPLADVTEVKGDPAAGSSGDGSGEGNDDGTGGSAGAGN